MFKCWTDGQTPSLAARRIRSLEETESWFSFWTSLEHITETHTYVLSSGMDYSLLSENKDNVISKMNAIPVYEFRLHLLAVLNHILPVGGGVVFSSPCVVVPTRHEEEREELPVSLLSSLSITLSSLMLKSATKTWNHISHDNIMSLSSPFSLYSHFK